MVGGKRDRDGERQRETETDGGTETESPWRLPNVGRGARTREPSPSLLEHLMCADYGVGTALTTLKSPGGPGDLCCYFVFSTGSEG